MSDELVPYAGKRCKKFTDMPIKRERKAHNVEGQLNLFTEVIK